MPRALAFLNNATDLLHSYTESSRPAEAPPVLEDAGNDTDATDSNRDSAGEEEPSTRT